MDIGLGWRMDIGLHRILHCNGYCSALDITFATDIGYGVGMDTGLDMGLHWILDRDWY